MEMCEKCGFVKDNVCFVHGAWCAQCMGDKCLKGEQEVRDE